MNIKQASEQSGVSAPNIRFYEKEGLLTPARRQGNDYRDYTAGDVRTLKLIRMLRMLDVPLSTIKAVLHGEQPLQQALQAQQTVLEQQAAQLAAAMQFCADLARQAPQTDTLDVDACLTRMESPASQQGFFSGWMQDYCTLAQVQHQKHFFFIPQGSINTPQEFTAALQAYAEEKEIQFTLTKEGMPLLRYRTKDLCSLNYEPCDCGRTCVRMSRIVGRSDDMLIIRGVNIFPSQVESVVLELPEFEPHYRLIVDRVNNLDTLEVQVEVRENYYSDEVGRMMELRKRIANRLHSVLGISAEIRLMEPHSIERSEGKSQRVIDKRVLK